MKSEYECVQRILAWQAAKVVGHENEERAKKRAMLLMVDLDEDTITPMVIGEMFEGKLLKVGESKKWTEVRDFVIDHYVNKDYVKDAKVFFSEDAARKRFAKEIYFDSIGFFSNFRSVNEDQPVNGDRWTHCVQYLFEDDAVVPEGTADESGKEKHLFSCIWIVEVDAYKRNQSALRYIAQHDQLTGLYNRHMLSELLKRDVDSILIIMDVNFFKTINDTYGHDTGDEALRVLAQRLEEIFYHKQNDLIFRLGGDEFLVVTLDTDEERAKECMERLIEPINMGEITFTVSVGYAVNNGDIKAALKDADNALYLVKKNGRKGYLKGQSEKS